MIMMVTMTPMLPIDWKNLIMTKAYTVRSSCIDISIKFYPSTNCLSQSHAMIRNAMKAKADK